MKIITLFFEHITNWGLVWFGVIFWGSIFNATSTYFFQNSHDLSFTLLAYLLGLTLGLLANRRGWVWIN
jgi:hypothetical protein